MSAFDEIWQNTFWQLSDYFIADVHDYLAVQFTISINNSRYLKQRKHKQNSWHKDKWFSTI